MPEAAQILRAAGNLIRLAGLEARWVVLCEEGTDVDPLEVLDLISDAAGWVADELDPAPVGVPAGTPTEPESRRRGRRGPPDALKATVLALLAKGWRDHEVAPVVGLTYHQVHRIRREARIPAAPKPNERSNWEARIREAHGRGLTYLQIAAELGFSVRTVQEYAWRLKLRANRHNTSATEEILKG